MKCGQLFTLGQKDFHLHIQAPPELQAWAMIGELDP